MPRKEKKTIGILTNFQEFNTSYSLTGIVVDQALMLLENNHKVVVFVNQNFNPKYNADARVTYLLNKYPENFELVKLTKFMHLIDYTTKSTVTEDHKEQSLEAGKIFADKIIKNDIDVLYTHDFIFTGWNYPYSLAIKETDKLLINAGRKNKWLHWIHSVPNLERKDWWNINEYGDNHFVVFPNGTEINRVAECFGTNPSRVRIIPHIKDIRTWYDFSENTFEFTRRYPGVLHANIIQVYPVSTDRMSAKQLELVIKIFGYMKQAKVPIFLCVANQWATGRQIKENIDKYILLAEHCGLEYGKEFVFTSEYSTNPDLTYLIENAENWDQLDEVLPQDENSPAPIKEINWNGDFEEEKIKALQAFQPYAIGISRKMLRELQLLSNVFLFPTREESFGLVGPETSFSGALCIINRSLTMQYEVMGHNVPSFDFGSYTNNTPAINNEGYIRGVAHAVLNRLYSNEAIMTKVYTRQRYNMDSIYTKYYIPFAI